MTHKILITPKISPDLDGLACAYAYRHLLVKQGKDATEGIFGQPHVEAQYLIDRFNINDVARSPSVAFDSFILVDASDMAGMPDVVRAEEVIEVIDHREIHKAHELFPKAKIRIEKVGAAATQIVEQYQDAYVPIDRNSAILLYGAIYSNTLNFKATVTTQRDRNAVEWLQKQIQIPEGLVHDMFVAKSEAANGHLEQVLKSDFKEFLFHSKHIGIAQLEVIQLDNLVKNHLDHMLNILHNLKRENGLQFVFLTAVDLEQGFNLFITDDADAQLLLSDVLKIRFVGHVGKMAGMLLRKQLVPLIFHGLESL